MGCRSCCAPAQRHWGPGQEAELGQGLCPGPCRGFWGDRDGNATGALGKGFPGEDPRGRGGVWGVSRAALGCAGADWHGLGCGGRARGGCDSGRTAGTHQRRVQDVDTRLQRDQETSLVTGMSPVPARNGGTKVPPSSQRGCPPIPAPHSPPGDHLGFLPGVPGKGQQRLGLDWALWGWGGTRVQGAGRRQRDGN